MRINGELALAIEYRFASLSFALYGRAKVYDPATGEWTRFRVLDVTTEPIEKDERYLHAEPFLEFSEEDAQRLLEELWKAGLRPQEVGTAGERSALIAARDWAQSVADRLLPVKARP